MTVTIQPPSFLPDPRRGERASDAATRERRSTRTDEIVEMLRLCHVDERDRLREQLIAVNMPVARAIATRYHSRGIASEDLEQIAYLALTKAAHRFDPSAGHAFLAFSVPTIRGEIRRYFRDHGWMVRPTRRIQELQQRITRAEADLALSLGRPPAAREVAEHLDEEVDLVLEAKDGQGCFFPSSLDRTTGEGETTLGDLLGSDDTGVQSAEARVLLAPAVRRLGDRDRQILQMRFFDGLTQHEIGDRLGITQMQVSRLLSRIFRDLRKTVGPLDEEAAARTRCPSAAVPASDR